MDFDPPGPTFRHEKYTEYKAHRPPIPEDLKIQMGRVREMVKALDIPIYELPGYEADDTLGTLSVQASRLGLETIIVTGDADILQLVTPQVRVLMPRPRGAFSDTMLYDEAAVSQKYDVKPEHIADLKALVGDIQGATLQAANQYKESAQGLQASTQENSAGSSMKTGRPRRMSA